MQGLALLSGFAAVTVLGFFLMSKLDNWLAAPQNKEDAQNAVPHLKIAASQLDSVPVVSAILKELSRQYPDLHCTLVLGQEREITDALTRGSIDLAIVSEHIDATPFVQYRDIILDPQPLCIAGGMVEMRTLNRSATHQRLLWKTSESRPYTLELICQLCGQP